MSDSAPVFEAQTEASTEKEPVEILDPSAVSTFESPVGFIMGVLRQPLYDWQGEFVSLGEDIQGRKKLSMVAPNGSGKSAVIITGFTLWWLAVHKRGRVVITTKDSKQLDNQIEPALRAHTGKLDGWKFIERRVENGTGGFAVLFTTDDAGRAEGWHQAFLEDGSPDPESPLLMIVDEAKSVDPKIFEAIDRCTYNVLIYVSSPGLKQGRFYESQESDKGFVAMKVGLSQCPHIPQARIDDIIRTYGADHPFTRSTLYGEFMDEDQETMFIISPSAVRALLEDPPEFADGRQYAFCDFAAGGDECVFAHKRGNRIELVCWKEPNTMASVGLFIQQFHKRGLRASDIYGDEGGLGGPIIDRMAETGWAINRVNNGSPALNPDRYENRGAEMWHLAGIQFQNRTIILPADPKLQAQLTTRKMKPLSDGRIGVESKKDMKKRGLSSPDRCVVEGTLVLSARGQVPIESICVGEKVWTRMGWKSVTGKEMTNPDAEITQLTLANGMRLQATSTHPLHLPDRGYCTVDKIEVGDRISTLWQQKSSSSTESNSFATQTPKANRLQGIFTLTTRSFANYTADFIRRSGDFTMAQYLLASMSTTRTATGPSMIFQTLSAYRSGSTTPFTTLIRVNAKQGTLSILQKSGRSPNSGMDRQKALSGTGRRESYLGKIRSSLRCLAYSVGRKLKLGCPQPSNIAPKNAGIEQDGYSTVIEKLDAGRGRVWNLAVEDCHEYYANGILSHNSDAVCGVLAIEAEIAASAFDADGLKHLENAVRSPKLGTLSPADFGVNWKDDATGWLQAWELPTFGRAYVACLKAGKDGWSVFILRKACADEKGKPLLDAVVARIKPPCEWDAAFLAGRIDLLLKWYGNPVIVPDVRNGMDIMERLKDMGASIYRRPVFDRTQSTGDLFIYGWETTEKNVLVAVSALSRVIRERSFDVPCSVAVNDFRGYTTTDLENGDTICLGIGLQCFDAAMVYTATNYIPPQFTVSPDRIGSIMGGACK